MQSKAIMETYKCVLCLALLLVLFSTPTVGTETYSDLDCNYDIEYGGPQDFKEIFAGTPNKPARLSQDQSRDYGGFAQNIASGVISSLPFGSLLSGFFNGFISLFSPVDNALATAINQLYDYIELEVKNLKLYVDQEIVELKIDTIQSHVGGLFEASRHCTSYNDTEHLLTCLETVHLLIASKKDIIMPSLDDPSRRAAYSESELRKTAAALESSLPMFRHYGDLLIMVTLEMLECYQRLKDYDLQQTTITDLKSEIQNLINYYNKARAIVELHSVAAYNIDYEFCHIRYGNELIRWSTISCNFGQGAKSCTSKNMIIDGPGWDDLPPYFYAVSQSLWWNMNDFMAAWETFRNVKLPEVRKYYNTEFGETIANWETVIEKFESSTR